MKDVKPCPYCGGEVEVVKLEKKKGEKASPYRIQCMKCHALVARGFGFPNETEKEAKERIEDYNNYIKNTFDPERSNKIRIGDRNKFRDWQAARGSQISYDDEEMEVHDISNRRCRVTKRNTSVYDT